MKETIKKLKTGVIEIQTEVTHTETTTINPEILKRDIQAAKEVVVQRENELEVAKRSLKDLKELKVKIDKIK